MSRKPMQTALLQGSDGVEIFYRFWLPPTAKAAVIMLHGAAVHSGLHYAALGRQLYLAGYAVYAPDLRGHGRSGGPRGHLEDFEDFATDLQSLINKVKETHKGKIILWGESLGGLIALDYASRFPKKLDGLIASAPGLHLKGWLPFPFRFYLQNLSCWLPNMQISAHDLVEQAVSDPKLVARAKEDPLLVEQFTINYLKEVIEAGYDVSERLPKIVKPCFFQLAGSDQVVDTPAVVQSLSTVGSKHKTLKIYDGLNHCLFLERPREVFQDTLQWLDQLVALPS